MICTDENSLGAGLVHYRSNDMRSTIPGFCTDML